MSSDMTITIDRPFQTHAAACTVEGAVNARTHKHGVYGTLGILSMDLS